MQAQLLMVRKCLNNSVNHLLRTLPPEVTVHHLVDPFNAIVKTTIETILEVELTPLQWGQMRLSVHEGGHGLGIHSMTPYAAYAASFYAAYPVLYASCPSVAVNLSTAVALPLEPAPYPVQDFVQSIAVLGYKDYNCVEFLGMEPSTSGKLQSKLMVSHREASRLSHIASLEATGDPIAVAFYHSNATVEGSAFIDAKAKSACLMMSNASMMLAVKRRYHIRVCPDNLRCTCKGKPLICPDGLHILNKCGKGPERIQAHDGLVDVVSVCGKYCGLRSDKEIKGALQAVDPDNRERPDGQICGLSIHPKLVYDVKVTETITSNLTMAQARITDRAVKTGEAEKNRKYKDKVAAEGGLFIPLSISTAGGFGAGFKTVFDLLIKHAAEYRSIPSAVLRIYWLRRISVSLQNGMANCFYKHVGRANTPAFYDESMGQGVVIEQAYDGPVSVSNRRRRG
jgi:hypothetical protein